MKKWTAEDKALVAQRLKAGDTAAQIGARLNVSRSAITGLIDRDKDLAAIGFVRRRKNSRMGGQPSKFTPEERQARRKQYMSAYNKWRRSKSSNIVAFPIPARHSSDPSQKSPILRVASNNIPLMIEDWLKKNGGPRRFEFRESSDYMTVKDYLEERGVTVKLSRNAWNNSSNQYSISSGMGRPRTVSWFGVMQTVDSFRIAEGKQPVLVGQESVRRMNKAASISR